jgi:hypothetical protein
MYIQIDWRVDQQFTLIKLSQAKQAVELIYTLETVFPVHLKRIWMYMKHIVHAVQDLSSFCFEATWVVWTRLVSGWGMCVRRCSYP